VLYIDAIESFRSTIGNLDAEKTKFIKPDVPTTKLKVSGVDASVSINMMTEETDREEKRSIGTAILVFSKPAKKEDKMAARCKAVALPVYELLKSHPTH
jgi:hypothetical protein